MPPLLDLHTYERRRLFGGLLLASLLLTGVAGLLVRQVHHDPPAGASSQGQKITRLARTLDDQRQHFGLLDTLHQQLLRYNPQVRAAFVDADVRNLLEETRNVYVDHRQMSFYRSFDQTATFYEMLFYDKQIIAQQQANVVFFTRQLQDCQGGIGPADAAGPPAASR